jgi:phage-related protein
MSEIPPLNVRVTIDASGVQAGVAKTTAGLNQITQRTSKLTTAFGSLKTTMLGVLGGNILTMGVVTLTNALREAKDGVIADQVALARLDTVLNNVGITSQKTKDSVIATADAYYRLGFAGDDTYTAMGSLLSVTGDVDQATKLLAMSADYARYKNVSQTTAAQVLAKATMGNAKALKEMGITLDATLPKNEAITKAFDELNKRMGGQAVGYTKTFAGQMEILKEKFDTFLQIIAVRVLPVLSAFLSYITENGQALLIYGGIVLTTIAIIKTYGAVTFAMKSIQQAYAFWTYAQAASTNVFKFAMVQLNAVMLANPVGLVIVGIMALGVAFVWAWNKFEGFRKGVVKGIQIIVNAFGYLLGYWATALKVVAKIPGMGWAKDASEALDKAANSVRKYSDGLDSLADKKIKTPKIPGFVKPGDPTGIKGNVDGSGNKITGKGGSGGGGGNTFQTITVYASNTNDIERQMAKAAKNGRPIGAK